MIVGAGGHGRVILDMALAAGMEVAGYVDSVHTPGSFINDVQVLGNNDYLADAGFIASHVFIVAIGNQKARRDLSLKIKNSGGELATVIHPLAVVSPMAMIGKGTVVVAGAIINTGARIGDYCIINTAATIDHDNHLEDGVQICPGANLAGTVHCGENAFIGTGAVVIPGIRIGADAIVGAGAVVIRNVGDGQSVAGNPASEIRR